MASLAQSNSELIDPASLELRPLANQVAGHAASVYTSKDDLFVIKKSLEKEIDFYHRVNTLSTSLPHDSTLKSLLHYLPSYRGKTTIPSTDSESGQDEAIVIENLTSSKKFSKPNTLDVKLGTQLWDEDDATEEKKARMDKVSQETTSGETGIRLTGWQTHSTSDPSRVVSTSKKFGKSIASKDLSTGLRLFFCVPKAEDAKIRQSVLSSESKIEAKGSDPSPSSTSTNQDRELKILAEETSKPPRLRPEYIKALLKSGLLPSLLEIRDIFQNLECRMRGGSLLIIFEGDEKVLTKELQAYSSSSSSKDSTPSLPGLKPGRSGLDPSSEERHGDQDLKRLINVRIIDFAHFKFCKGQGIDEGVLKGIESLIGLIEGVVKDLED